MLTHNARHLGQISMLAHQMGFPLPMKATAGLWNWESFGKVRSNGRPGDES